MIKLLILLLFVQPAFSQTVGDVPDEFLSGTYIFKGVATKLNETWKCYNNRPRRIKSEFEIKETQHNLVVKRAGYFVYGKINGHGTFFERTLNPNGCEYLYNLHHSRESSERHGDYGSTFIPIENGIPTVCDKGRYRSNMFYTRERKLTWNQKTSCKNGRLYKTDRYSFHYGYALDENNKKVWAPEPIVFSPSK